MLLLLLPAFPSLPPTALSQIHVTISHGEKIVFLVEFCQSNSVLLSSQDVSLFEVEERFFQLPIGVAKHTTFVFGV